MSPTKPAATWFAFVYSVFLCLKPENAALNKSSWDASFRSFSSKTPWEQPRHSVKYRISSVSSSFAGSILYKGSMFFDVNKKSIFFILWKCHLAKACIDQIIWFLLFFLTKWAIGQIRLLYLVTLFCQVTLFLPSDAFCQSDAFLAIDDFKAKWRLLQIYNFLAK